MMLVGMLAWVVRYLLFAYGDNEAAAWMLYGGIILHGICYDFFFVTGQIYIDNKADASIRNSAQGLITFATYGLGMLVGSYVSGFVTEKFVAAISSPLDYDWESVWLVPATIAVLVSVLFVTLFREKPKTVNNEQLAVNSKQ
jgi:MFS family permease